MHRFFVPPDHISHGNAIFRPDQARQMATVLRLRPGERVAALDNAGWLYEVELTRIAADTAEGKVCSRRLAPNEPRTKLTIYPALLKSDKLELVFQKCTEIGASGFAPIISDRCNVGSVVSENRRQRWERIIAEAAEQSERGRLPQLLPATVFPQACEQARGRGLSLIAWERGERSGIGTEITSRVGARNGSRPFAINLFVGPEGGFTNEEIDLARAYGIIPVSLGPHILRAETAAVVGVTLILAYAGDLE